MALPLRYPESDHFSPFMLSLPLLKGLPSWGPCFNPCPRSILILATRVILSQCESYHVVSSTQSFQQLPISKQKQNAKDGPRHPDGCLHCPPHAPLTACSLPSLHTGLNSACMCPLRTFAPPLPMPGKLSPLMSLWLTSFKPSTDLTRQSAQPHFRYSWALSSCFSFSFFHKTY